MNDLAISTGTMAQSETRAQRDARRISEFIVALGLDDYDLVKAIVVAWIAATKDEMR